MTTIPLNKLSFGHDFPGGSINARKGTSDEGLAELGATILDKGLISPLIVVKAANGKTYVSEGNRRLRAMRLLVSAGKLPKDWPVKVDELAEGVDPLEASLTANVMQLPMHEVDRYETFAKLADAGKSANDIASSFGTSALEVKRSLTLGKISPALREAWRRGVLKPEAAKTFAIVADHALQDQVYATLAKAQNLYRHAILVALNVSDRGGDLAFVGKEAYLAAGGHLSEDLFEDGVRILDVELLRRLDREKIEAECRRLINDGWGWASLGRDLPYDHWRWRRRATAINYTEEELFRLDELQPAADGGSASSEAFRKAEEARVELKRIENAAALRSFTAADKAATGCILHRHGDRIDIEVGMERPADQVPSEEGIDSDVTAASTDSAPADEAAGVSRSLSQTLSEQLTTAAAMVLVDEPDLALRILVAALQTRYRRPAQVQIGGMPGLMAALKGAESGLTDRTFAEALVMTLRLSPVHLKAELAPFVAASLDLTDASRDNPAKAVRGHQELIDALNPAGFLAAARQAFDAEGFFDRAPASVALEAIAEMGGPKPDGKKGVVALAAANLARELGWLPLKLRSSHYEPPRYEDHHRPAAPAAKRRKKAPAETTAAAP